MESTLPLDELAGVSMRPNPTGRHQAHSKRWIRRGEAGMPGPPEQCVSRREGCPTFNRCVRPRPKVKNLDREAMKISTIIGLIVSRKVKIQKEKHEMLARML